MRVSQLLGERYKEKPADASLISHIFLLRGGYIRQVASGIFSLLPPAQRVTRKIEEIIRQRWIELADRRFCFLWYCLLLFGGVGEVPERRQRALKV